MQHLSRKLALATATLALTVPLASCGFDYATNRYYTPAVGANERAGMVDVLAAVIVSAEDGSGTFITSLSNNSDSRTTTFTELSGDGLQVSGLQPTGIEPNALVNLADPPTEIAVTGDFEAGQFVEVTLDFDHGQTTTLKVPVVPATEEFAGLDATAGGSGDTGSSKQSQQSGEKSGQQSQQSGEKSGQQSQQSGEKSGASH